MFEQVFEILRKTTESTVQMQQEMLNKWMGMMPNVPMHGARVASLPLQTLQHRWTEFMTELLKRQREVIEKSLRLGGENIEKAFSMGEVKSPEEIRVRTVELWQKCLESLRETNEAQLREFQTATEKWLGLLARPVG